MEVEQLRLEVLKVAVDSQRTGETRHILPAAKAFEAYVLGEKEVTPLNQTPKKRRGRPPKRP